MISVYFENEYGAKFGVEDMNSTEQAKIHAVHRLMTLGNGWSATICKESEDDYLYEEILDIWMNRNGIVSLISSTGKPLLNGRRIGGCRSRMGGQMSDTEAQWIEEQEKEMREERGS